MVSRKYISSLDRTQATTGIQSFLGTNWKDIFLVVIFLLAKWLNQSVKNVGTKINSASYVLVVLKIDGSSVWPSEKYLPSHNLSPTDGTLSIENQETS